MLFFQSNNHYECCQSPVIYEAQQITPGELEVILKALNSYKDGSVEGRKAAELVVEIEEELEDNRRRMS